MNKVSILIVSCLVVYCNSQALNLVDNWSGNNFFGNFDFFTGGDPTHGYVQYVNQSIAQNNGLLNVNGDVVHIYSDHTHVASGSGRMSVRITSKKVYNSGLFTFDLTHMPTGCGTWPAIWTVGPGWPNAGEIDIIEGVNKNTENSMTLHSSNGCTMAGVNRNMTGKATGADCWVSDPKQPNNAGCGVTNSVANSYGAGFNSNNGGVYAMHWTSAGVKVWFFPRNRIPSDLTSNKPVPTSWPTPDSTFPFGSNCPSNHFSNHQVVLDLTFCGDWANAVFGSSGCPGTCNDYVKNNPNDFAEAYWTINYFKIFQ